MCSSRELTLRIIFYFFRTPRRNWISEKKISFPCTRWRFFCHYNHLGSSEYLKIRSQIYWLIREINQRMNFSFMGKLKKIKSWTKAHKLSGFVNQPSAIFSYIHEKSEMAKILRPILETQPLDFSIYFRGIKNFWIFPIQSKSFKVECDFCLVIRTRVEFSDLRWPIPRAPNGESCWNFAVNFLIVRWMCPEDSEEKIL